MAYLLLFNFSVRVLVRMCYFMSPCYIWVWICKTTIWENRSMSYLLFFLFYVYVRNKQNTI